MSLNLPEAIGGYRVLQRISEGGMGAVLLGRKEGARGFEKLVAIKVLLPQHISSDEVKDLFFSEAQLAARLTHPNVCQVFDYGEEADLYYIVMEFINGVSVQEILELHYQRGDRMPPELAARIVADAARGLHHAHTLRGDDGDLFGVVHRDVSPQNIIVTYDGCPKVLDFGIAKSRARATTTQHGIVRGKPAYMSPEQTRADELDARSDIFSLGTLLHELLVGDTLFVRDNVFATINAITNDEIPDPRAAAPDLDEGYASIAMCALSRDREERFSNADAMARALDLIVAKGGHHATATELAKYLSVNYPRRQITHDLMLPTPNRPANRTPNRTPADEATVDLRARPLSNSYPHDAVTLGASSSQALREEDLFPSARPSGRTLALVGLGAIGALVAILVISGVLPWPGSSGMGVNPAAVVDAAAEADGAELALTGAELGDDDGGAVANADDGPAVLDSGQALASADGGETTDAVDASADKVVRKPRGKKPRGKRFQGKRPRRDRDKADKEPAVEAYGTLIVRAMPYGLVTLDGRPLGNTPIKLKVRAGEHVIEVLAPDTGASRFRERVTVVEGIDKVVKVSD